MRRTGHRTRFLLLIAIFFAVKIFFDIARIQEMNRQRRQWDALEKSTAETARKMHRRNVDARCKKRPFAIATAK